MEAPLRKNAGGGMWFRRAGPAVGETATAAGWTHLAVGAPRPRGKEDTRHRPCLTRAEHGNLATVRGS
jgi:hypothetical protein